MFCTMCGKQFDGNFCPKCGQKSSALVETVIAGTPAAGITPVTLNKPDVSGIPEQVQQSTPPQARTRTDASGQVTEFSLTGTRITIRSCLTIVTNVSARGNLVEGIINYHGHVLHRKPRAISFQISELVSVSRSFTFILYFIDIFRLLLGIAVELWSFEYIVVIPIFLTLCFFPSLNLQLSDGRKIKIPLIYKCEAEEFLQYIGERSSCKLPR